MERGRSSISTRWRILQPNCNLEVPLTRKFHGLFLKTFQGKFSVWVIDTSTLAARIMQACKSNSHELLNQIGPIHLTSIVERFVVSFKDFIMD